LTCSDRGEALDEICGNAEDEDCDGTAQDCIALPALNGEFPGPTGASSASAADVTFDFASPGASDSWTALCRTGVPGAVDELPWTECPSGNNLPVKPFTPAQSEASALNGLRETQIRFQWNNGDVSDTFTRVHYIHNSLNGVPLCPKVSEELVRNYFDKAAARLVRGDTPRFDLDNDLQLRSPFIQIRFDPPIDSTFSVRDGDGEIEPLSLRRRFVFETNDKQLLLMFRVYQSRRGFGCHAMTTHKYVGGSLFSGPINYHHRYNWCDAVVLNKQGAGVCLRKNTADSAFIVADTEGHGQVFLYSYPQVPYSTYYCSGSGSTIPSYTDVCADNFMWRQFVRKRGSTGYLEHFSPKCFNSPTCAGSEEIYLPDRGLFPDIFP
jgi:hypothetical protein